MPSSPVSPATPLVPRGLPSSLRPTAPRPASASSASTARCAVGQPTSFGTAAPALDSRGTDGTQKRTAAGSFRVRSGVKETPGSKERGGLRLHGRGATPPLSAATKLSSRVAPAVVRGSEPATAGQSSPDTECAAVGCPDATWCARSGGPAGRPGHQGRPAGPSSRRTSLGARRRSGPPPGAS